MSTTFKPYRDLDEANEVIKKAVVEIDTMKNKVKAAEAKQKEAEDKVKAAEAKQKEAEDKVKAAEAKAKVAIESEAKLRKELDALKAAAPAPAPAAPAPAAPAPAAFNSPFMSPTKAESLVKALEDARSAFHALEEIKVKERELWNIYHSNILG